MNRVAFLIDGFNLYHSVKQAEQDFGTRSKWLDIWSLCSSYLSVIGGGSELEAVHYFSALAVHLEATNPDVTARHRAFLRCLKATGVEVNMSSFKKKTIRCDSCEQRFKRYEEKETDVAIAAKLFELFARDSCDTVVMMTGDTDLAPAFRTAAALYPTKRILFAFPYKRKNKELAQLAPGSFTIDRKQYAKHQLANPFPLSKEREILKPEGW